MATGKITEQQTKTAFNSGRLGKAIGGFKIHSLQIKSPLRRAVQSNAIIDLTERESPGSWSEINFYESIETPYVYGDITILDTVGILSRCYQYAEIAYVGGAMGSSELHNILEPASEGIPIIIGKNYSKFDEAIELINMEGIISVANSDQLKFEIQKLIDESKIRMKMGEINKKYIQSKIGATEKILNNLYKLMDM